MHYQLTSMNRRAREYVKVLAKFSFVVLVTLLLGGLWFGGTAWGSQVLPAGGGSSSDASTSGNDAAYVETMRQKPFYAPVSDGQLIGLGHSMCQALDNGATNEQLIEALEPIGFSASDVEWLEGASIVNYCPWHSAAIPSSFDVKN